MQIILRSLGALLFAAVLSGCAQEVETYSGPGVTRVAVFKESRRLYLMHGDQALRGYDIALGFSPVGDKKVSGDGKTPEGHYIIDRRNPESEFYLSLGISYPNRADIREARRRGADPGGDIFIHGRGNVVQRLTRDWTWGCIAVTDPEMREIYKMVRTGTPISIYQ